MRVADLKNIVSDEVEILRFNCSKEKSPGLETLYCGKFLSIPTELLSLEIEYIHARERDLMVISVI